MRTTYLLLALVCIFSVARTQDTLTVSPRIGKVVDAFEREYFGLLPQAGPFSEAVFVHQSGSTGDINVFIESDDGISRIANTITRAEYYQIGKYIEEYEPVLYRMRSSAGTLYLDDKYGGLFQKYLLRRPRPMLDNYYTVTYIQNGQRETLHGSLLYCDGMYIVVDPDPDHNAFTDAVAIPSNTIEEVYTSSMPLYLAAFVIPAFAVGTLVGLLVHSSDIEGSAHDEGATIGVLSGMAAGAFGLTVAWLTERSMRNTYKSRDQWKFEVLPGLVEYQFFRHGLPPELRQRLYPDE